MNMKKIFSTFLILMAMGKIFASNLWVETHEEMVNKLSSPIKKEIQKAPQKEIYVVELENKTQAIFKKRPHDGFTGIFSEVLAYKFSYEILGLDHTVPPTIGKIYRGFYGTLQPLINSNLNLNKDDDLKECFSKANPESYDNLQIFLYCASMGDLNVGGIIPWLKKERINFTYVDSEFAFQGTQPYYGGCPPEFSNTLREYTDRKYVLTSKYTLDFPPRTIEKLKLVDKRMLENIWGKTLTDLENVSIFPKISSEDKNIYIKNMLKDINTIIKVATEK